eukprot:jgi/Orpsp1_1/1190331/evm.model.d7180000078314.1
MSFLYKPWTSEYQSQYTWKLRNQFRKPQDILEKQLEELKELQDANNKKLSMLENELKTKFIPDDDELYITERIFKKEAKDVNSNDAKTTKGSEDLVLPKLSDDSNVVKADSCNNNNRPSSSSSNRSGKSNKANRSSGCKSPNNYVTTTTTTTTTTVKETRPSINEQVDALVSHFRRDGYGNNPWLGNKPTSFEYEKMKKLPPSKANIKNYDDNLKLRRAKMYDEYRKEIDLRRLKQLFPYVNFDELNYNAQTQTYDDGIISGTYLSEYGDKYVNWNHPPYPYNKRFERCSQKISQNHDNTVGTSTSEDKKNEAVSSINSLSKQMEKKLVLEDEDLEICEKCNGYYIKPQKTSNTNNTSNNEGSKEKITTTTTTTK